MLSNTRPPNTNYTQQPPNTTYTQQPSNTNYAQRPPSTNYAQQTNTNYMSNQVPFCASCAQRCENLEEHHKTCKHFIESTQLCSRCGIVISVKKKQIYGMVTTHAKLSKIRMYDMQR